MTEIFDECEHVPPCLLADGDLTPCGRSLLPLEQRTGLAPTVKRCAQCGHAGPPQLFEPFNTVGNLACRARTLCELRQQRADPAALLGTLLREFGQHDDGKSGELDTLSTRQLAELNLDTHGPRGEFMGGFAGSLRVYLGSRGDSAQAIADTEADRLARKRRRAALQGGGTGAAGQLDSSQVTH